MATTSVSNFWKHMADSGLVTADALSDLQGRFSNLRGMSNANSALLAEWLITEKALSRYHADILLRGRPGPFVYGDFLVRERIMKGRLAGNFRAVHRPTGHPVILVFHGGDKPFGGSWDAAVTAGLRVAEIEDPRLTRCHEFVDAGRYRFGVIEDLDGRSLADHLDASARMSVSEACSIAYATTMALTAVHQADLSHGHVRPVNLWRTSDESTLLMFFPLTPSPLAPYLPLNVDAADYAAPELDPRRPVPTAASDIYALGCMLYELLAGHPPFFKDGLTTQQKMARHASEPIAPLHQVGNVPEAVNQVVSYMMAKNVSVRYPDATTVTEALRPFIDPSLINDRLPPSATRAAYEAVAHRRRSGVARTSASKAVDPPAVDRKDVAAAAAVATAAAVSPPSSSAAPGPVVQQAAIRQMLDDGPGAALATAPQALSDPVTGQPATTGRMKRSTRNTMIAVGSALLVLIMAIAAFTWLGPEQTDRPDLAKTENGEDEDAEPGDENGNDTPRAATDGSSEEVGSGGSDGTADGYEEVIEDDGSTLWASPTQRGPPVLRFIPPGAQLIFSMRSGDLLGTAGGRDILTAMGPAGERFRQWVNSQTGFELEELEQLDIAFFPASSGSLPYCLVVRPRQSQTKEQLLTKWGSPTPATYQGSTYYRTAQMAYYIPKSTKDSFAAGAVKQIHEVIDTLEEPSWLAPPLEKLRLSADSGRHINVFFLPTFVRSARDSLYPGQLQPLHEVVSWVMGSSDAAQAGLLSFHLDDTLFAELRMYCARDEKPLVLAREFHDRLGQAANLVSSHLLSLSVSPYSRPVLSSLPGMLRSLHQYTRYGPDQPRGRQAVLRCYLPVGAAQNLAVATDLALLESGGTGSAVVSTAPKSVSDRLKQSTSLAFSNDNLINALALLSDDIGVKIEIKGSDLQLEGITKNQSFGIDLRNRPAEEILTQIVLLANPEKVSRPSDPALKLIYVVKEKFDGGQDVIWVTTRAAAAKRGDALPPQFRSGADAN